MKLMKPAEKRSALKMKYKSSCI